MQTDYTGQLEAIATAARDKIRQLLAVKKEVVLFTITDDGSNECSIDIYDDVPEFPHYDKYDYVECVAIKEIRQTKELIVITGILKGESFPDTVETTLSDLNIYDTAALADYLTTTQ